ncbi:hypothetical protein GCM10022244_19170 [Streptomyces gulbargensis]|uniref:Uncharacterized protein n=1 Tax=Streptomyces gulbargensis TaxID=364901 RepID=A0ABP7LX21_9ACTN
MRTVSRLIPADDPAPHAVRPRVFLSDQAGSGSGVWCVRSQGGGGSPCGGGTSRARRATGESATDDNAAKVRARRREPGKIRKKGPRSRVLLRGRPRADTHRHTPRVR